MNDAQDELLRFLREETLFQATEPRAVERLASLARVQRIPAGATLFRMGQRCEELHFLLDGQARVRLLSKDGRERTLHVVLPGDMVGAVPFFDGGEYPCTVSADTPCRFVAFRRDELLGLLTRDGEVTLGILGGLVARQRKVVTHLEELSFEDAGSRLWRYLLDRSGPLGSEGTGDFPRIVEPLPTRERIASEIGTVREVVSRRVSRLVRDGHVRLEGRRLVLLSAPEEV